MSYVYTIGDVEITFDQPLLDGLDEVNFAIGCGPGRGGSMASIDEADIATLYAYAASRDPLPWSMPEGLPDVPDAFGSTYRVIHWPAGQRRVVWRFNRNGWWRTPVPSSEPFQVDAFQADAFDDGAGAGIETHIFDLALIDAGPA